MIFEDPVNYNLYNYSETINNIIKKNIKKKIPVYKSAFSSILKTKSHKEQQQNHRGIISFYLKNIEKKIRILDNVPKKKKLTIIDIYELILKLLLKSNNNFNIILKNIYSNTNEKSDRFKVRRNLINFISNEIKSILIKQKLIINLNNNKITKIKMLKSVDDYFNIIIVL